LNREELRLLVDFHYWARDRMLEALEPLTPEQFTRDMANSFRSIRDTVVHIYSAEWVWLTRWMGHSPTAALSAAQFPDLATIRTAWKELEPKVRSFLEGNNNDDLARRIEYRLINGQPGASIFWHMLQHVVNHASYHRGQVTTMLRQLGLTPPKSTDMIAFYRERGL
jgi:uncharacterized damage-inducible protein DinB